MMKRKIGNGSQGDVFLYENPNGQQAAVKYFNSSRTATNEKQILSLFTGLPHIVQLSTMELPTTSTNQMPNRMNSFGRTALLLDYYSQGDLYTLMENHPSVVANEDVAKVLLRQCLVGLAQLHSQGVVHRDLKPENIFLDQDFQAALGDFGLADWTPPQQQQQQQQHQCGCLMVEGVRGSRAYLAPEVVHADPSDATGGSFDGSKADVWSLGCVLFLMLTGNNPVSNMTRQDWYWNQIRQNNWSDFWSKHLEYSAVTSSLSEGVQGLVAKMLCADPARRPSAQQLLRDDPWLRCDLMSTADLQRTLRSATSSATC
jgi:serine/threonine protein kinase